MCSAAAVLIFASLACSARQSGYHQATGQPLQAARRLHWPGGGVLLGGGSNRAMA